MPFTSQQKQAGDPLFKENAPIDTSAFSNQKKSAKKTPLDFTRKQSGFGGMLRKPGSKKEVPDFPDEEDVSISARTKAKGKKVTAFDKRENPSNTSLRLRHERGDLPCQLDHGGVRNRIAWKLMVEQLDFHHYLPVFAGGLREVEEPYATLAEKGIHDMIQIGGPLGRISHVIPQLIAPIKDALNTRDRHVIIKVLNVLQKIAKCDPQDNYRSGLVLIRYSKDLLQILNLFVTQTQNLGDCMDYGSNPTKNLGELVMSTLETFELYGGRDAFINIKNIVPIYQSVVRK
jgi:hypothetical protein